MDTVAAKDVWVARLRHHGVVFYSHPQHHRFAWAVADTVANASIRATISRLAFRLHKRQLAVPLNGLVQRLELVIDRGAWLRAAAHQRPSHLWDHVNGLSDYQV